MDSFLYIILDTHFDKYFQFPGKIKMEQYLLISRHSKDFRLQI